MTTSASPAVVDRAIAVGVRRLQQETGVPFAFGGVGDGAEPLGAVLRHFVGNLGSSLKGVAVASGRGLGGRALASGSPAGVASYLQARTIDHTYDAAVAPERIHAVVAVPVMILGAPRGLLYLSTRDDSPIGTRAVSAAVATAQAIERDVLVESAVERRLAELERSPAPATVASDALADVAAELHALAGQVPGASARARLEELARTVRVLATPAAQPRARRERPHGGASLTPREVQVLQQVARGATNDEVGRVLGLRTHTVKAYLKSAASKLAAKNRVQAVHAARMAGYLD